MTAAGRRKFAAVMAVLIVVLDQASKQWALGMFRGGERVEILPFLDFTLAWNRGVSFGFFGAGGVPPWAFIIVALAISAFLGWLVWQAENRMQALGYAAIIGGAIGNVIDRGVHGAVVDFVLVYWGDWRFPVFNLADTTITLGVIIVIIDSLWPGRASTTS